MNPAFSFTGDSIVQIVSAIAAVISLFMAARQFRAKKWTSTLLWLLGACLWALILVFFLTFHIRLM